jgi:uncharacterized protein YqeY
MQNLKQQIQNDLKEAMKNKDAFLLGVLRMAVTAIKNKELEKRTKLSKTEAIEKLDEMSQLTDEEALAVMLSEAKKRKDAIEEFTKGGRQDLAEKEQKELEALKKYLPEQMGDEEIRKIVVGAIAQTGASDVKEMGKVMAAIMPQVKGKADGSLVNKIVKEELEGE